MNITIKITHTNGTVMDISIPVAIEQPVKTPATEASAVVTPEDEVTASEPAIPAQDAPSACHEIEQVLSFEKSLDANNISLGREKVGEDEEGAGRIGGVGERKGEGGEGEGEEGHLEQFKCVDGYYTLPPALYSDFCAAFGQPMVDRELVLARLWVETNPQKRKTRRGMGRFLNAWMCRSQGEKRVAVNKRTGSLLDAAPSRQEGW